MSEGRLPPFYCPYCGEEDIRPFGETAGEWCCHACLRVWQLRNIGVARRTTLEEIG
ncbi:MAG: hypothetical protein ACRDPW_01870 [Mycobacteriales bacterium]